MHIIFTWLRRLFGTLLSPAPPVDPLSRLSRHQLDDLPAHHPRSDDDGRCGA